jgi:hypothetical protein
VPDELPSFFDASFRDQFEQIAHAPRLDQATATAWVPAPRRRGISPVGWLLVLLVPASIPFALIATRVRLTREAVIALQARGANVFYDFERTPSGVTPPFEPYERASVLHAQVQAYRVKRFGDLLETQFALGIPLTDPAATTRRLDEIVDRELSTRLGSPRPIKRHYRPRSALGQLRNALPVDLLHNVSKVEIGFPLRRDDDLDPLRQFSSLADLSVDGGNLTGRALVTIAGLNTLQQLRLVNFQVTGPELAPITRLSHLERLELEAMPRVGDAAIPLLAALPRLSELHLIDTAISDRGLQELNQLTSLQRLWLRGDSFTPEGIHTLETIPRLRFVRIRSRDPEIAAAANSVRRRKSALDLEVIR